MSYVRFGSDGSDVYVYLDVGGYLCCCGCLLGDKWAFHTTDEMINHLDEHVKADHCVPQWAIEGLVADRDENDAWIANYDPVEERRQHHEANQRVTDIWQIAKDELGYTHPGPERFDHAVHQDAWERASMIYESRK